MKNLIKLLTILILLIIMFPTTLSITQAHCLSTVSPFIYDVLNDNQKVTTKKQIDDIFSRLEKINVSKLPKDYLEKTGLNRKKYRYARKNKVFYLVPTGMLPIKILGNNRISDLVSIEPLVNNKVPLLIDKKVLYKYIEMYKILKSKGYNADDIKITAGHRHPEHNDRVGGAYTSKHIIGQALDFDVGDIDNNGVADIKDKMIVYEILNKKVIKSKGGIGKYSWDPHGLHIDVRGHKARWDSFSRKK